MTPELERQAREVTPEPGGGVIERVARRVGLTANAQAVFGPPVERDGVTVIPVARIRWGFGGGEGSGEGEGRGAGGGVAASPAGYIEITDGRAEYHPIANLMTGLLFIAPIILASAVAARVVLRGLHDVIRGRAGS